MHRARPTPEPSDSDIHGDFQIDAARGRVRQQLLVRGNLSEWLRKHGAKPTKDPGRFQIGGFSVTVRELSAESMDAMFRIFGDPKYAPISHVNAG